MAAAARMVVVVRSVVVVAREAASVVKVAAARRRWRWMGRWWRRRMAVGGGAPIPLAAPNTHCGVRRGYGFTTSTQSAVLKNTGAYPEGIIGSECSGGGQTPVT